MIEEIKTLLARVDELKAENEEQLEALRLEFLSKKGKVNQLMANFRNVAADQKKEVGVYLNQLKTALQERFNTLKQEQARRTTPRWISRALPTPFVWVRVTRSRW